MKMMPGGPKLSSHYRLAGPSLAPGRGDHTMGVGGLSTWRHNICISILTVNFHMLCLSVAGSPAQPDWLRPGLTSSSRGGSLGVGQATGT